MSANIVFVTLAKRLSAMLVFAASLTLTGLGATPAGAHMSSSVPVRQQATTLPGQSTPPTIAPASATATTLPLDGPSADEGGGVVPRPNSGVKPQSSGDRGGWAQLTLWALIIVGIGSMFGRIAWGMYRHSRANPIA